MSLLLPIAAVCLCAAAVSLLRTLSARREVRASLARAAGTIVEPAMLPGDGRRLPGSATLARLAVLMRPGVERDDVALRLAAAGLARRVSAETYLAVQGLFVALSCFFGLLLAGGNAMGGLLFAMCGAAGSLVLPDRALKIRAGRRRDEVLAELPGALDLLCVSVEAGLAFDAALARVAGAIRGPLGEEFQLMLGEIRVGEVRTVALQRLADRIGVDDVAGFARAVARAEQLGTSIAQTLRVQAADARARRQLAAEETANKAPVKILFPTVFFIFPALFVVVLGPALVTFKGFLG